MGIVSGQICSKSPVPSASLSVLDPLLSEEDPAFLEVAMDSKGFSTAKKNNNYVFMHYQNNCYEQFQNFTFRNELESNTPFTQRVTSSPWLTCNLFLLAEAGRYISLQLAQSGRL